MLIIIETQEDETGFKIVECEALSVNLKGKQILGSPHSGKIFPLGTYKTEEQVRRVMNAIRDRIRDWPELIFQMPSIQTLEDNPDWKKWSEEYD